MRRRPDQRYQPPGTPVAPSTAGGVLRGRLVIVSGTGAGLFVYSPGAPANGNLLIAIASAAGSDNLSNAFPGPGATFFGTNGSSIQILPSDLGNAVIRFPSGLSAESAAFLLVQALEGSGATEFIDGAILGPQTTVDNSRVRMDLFSATVDGTTTTAVGRFNFNSNVMGTWSDYGFNLIGSIAATDPATGTVATPATAETYHTVPTLQNSWTQRNAVQSTYPLSSYWLSATGKLEMSLYLVAGTIANNTLLFTLGSDYIPAHTHIVPVETDKSGAGVDSTSGTPCIIIRGALEVSPGQVTIANFNSLTTRINQGNISVPMTL